MTTSTTPTDDRSTDAGPHVVFLTAAKGVERSELTGPWEALRAAGVRTSLATPDGATVATVEGDLEPAGDVPADLALADVDAADVDLLVLPGGTVNADTLRLEADAVALVRAVAASGAPVAAICHAPWLLVESDLVRGKDVTSYPSLRTDVTNAGGTWHDDAPVVCRKGGRTLVTARNPDDVPAFSAAILELLGHRDA
ncbi:DJ-1/PfpI/YhbO family deglycase/protease [Oerskovia flava]|uniref:DJ-1/PfpI/YhbO family deglycase/protease n=1 Tax=Oerskovia flava TaxID=2986422 RepID=UPI00223FF51E|nr:DJ-1/PfpI/YhbO family deglycase/protease [Oerskovia sp. JB1-3-2]